MKISSILTIMLVSCFLLGYSQGNSESKPDSRQVWITYLDKVARPVMRSIADDKLKANMTVALADNIDNKDNRRKVAYLEAFGRTLCGIAPWLQLEGGSTEEVKLRDQYRNWALKGISNAINPNARDYLKWSGGQPLVDASFVALALIRSPWLWEHLSVQSKQQLTNVLKDTRNTVPVYSNWILFTGVIEAFFDKYDLGYDPVRIEYAVREFTQHWYVGDGFYSDGMQFHMDYYNSIVIHPSLSTILEEVNAKHKSYPRELENFRIIGKRYAQVLERLINTDGSYPATGRSIVYRGGVFHHLANMALNKELPPSLTPGQVRDALTAVINKTLNAPNTFDKDGWLNIGLYGKQPSLAEFYITTGSLYICSDIFLPLGLPESDEFWKSPPAPWTSVKIWSGQDVPADHALDLTH